MPTGLAFRDGALYVVAIDKLMRYYNAEANLDPMPAPDPKFNTLRQAGQSLAGRVFRRALAERFVPCPFTAEARSRFQRRTRTQPEKSRRMIAAHGGLPMHLDGMAMTCHEQQANRDCRKFRERLDQCARGDLPAEAVITAPCNAPEITP